jgi:hypothetical protein
LPESVLRRGSVVWLIASALSFAGVVGCGEDAEDSSPSRAADGGANGCRGRGDADCPDAARQGPDLEEVAPSEENGFTELPPDCEKQDLLAQLQTSEDAISCGDLSYLASDEEKIQAVACARDAFDSQKPFHVLWVTLNDAMSDIPNGLVARLENGTLHIFSLEAWIGTYLGVDSQYLGAVATWRAGTLEIRPDCATTPDECFVFSPAPTWCECRVPGFRPKRGEPQYLLRCQRPR